MNSLPGPKDGTKEPWAYCKFWDEFHNAADRVVTRLSFGRGVHKNLTEGEKAPQHR